MTMPGAGARGESLSGVTCQPPVEQRIRIRPEGGTPGSISRKSTRRSDLTSCEPASPWHHTSGTSAAMREPCSRPGANAGSHAG
jgi:hypothetical protein